jgi:protein TonB
MTLAADYLEPGGSRLFRWLAAGLGALSFYAAAALLVFWIWPADSPTDEAGGAILIDMVEMAVESPSQGQQVADAPELAGVDPEAPSVEETPEPPPPEETVEPVVEDLPPVEEAPLAPEPEVVLPEKQEEQPKPAPPEKPVERPADKKTEPRPSRKQQQQQAADAPKGKPSPASGQSAASAPGFNPSPVVRTRAVYPRGALAHRTEGRVVVSFSVLPDGRVSNVRVVSATPPGVFEAAALKAVRTWRYRASANGTPHHDTTVDFTLK